MSEHRYAFLGTSRWWGIIAVVVLISLVCALLGYWQLTRYQGRAEQVELVETNYEADPVDLTELIGPAGGDVSAGHEWHPVRLTGQYLDPALVLPQRGVGGSPADHVVAVFAAQAPGGGTWLVLLDRGWYRTDSFADHTAALELPEGPVEVVARLRPAEAPSTRVLGEGQVHSLNPEQVAAQVLAGADPAPEAELVTGVYARIATEEVDGVNTLPESVEILPRPAADLGSHLSYAFQWWIFAIGALVGLVILARREADGTIVRLNSKSRGSREEDEDALVEEQLQASATNSA